MVTNAIFIIYSQTNILTYDTIDINNLILTCYSESGGNVFTAASKNLGDVKALICFEPQYMNEYLKKDNKNLTLGKKVIPFLLKQGAKVAIIARRKQGWQGKYLPQGVSAGDLILLPDDGHYSLLDYPDQSKPYDPSASPLLARRYSRLLNPKVDPVINAIRTNETGPIDYASAEVEAKVDDIIDQYRKAGMDDERIVKTVFTAKYNTEGPGGFYTHNFIVSSGQTLASDGFIFKFFHQALTQIG